MVNKMVLIDCYNTTFVVVVTKIDTTGIYGNYMHTVTAPNKQVHNGLFPWKSIDSLKVIKE